MMAPLAKKSLNKISIIASKHIVKQFAAKFGLAYFGHVDPRADEYELVRGLTSSTSHVDNHYTVGSYNGKDMIFVDRRNEISFPTKGAIKYRWLIMQFELNSSKLPHVFIDCRHHDAIFYAHMFVANVGIQDMTGYFGAESKAFKEKARVFASPSSYNVVGKMLTAEIAETIALHFSRFDYEFYDDKVLVYASNILPTPSILEEMLRVGDWLAERLNAVEI